MPTAATQTPPALALLRRLESEHRKVDKLLTKLAKADKPDDQARLLAEATDALMAHMTTEETEVYPFVETLEEEMGQEASNEHTLVREGLQTADRLIGMPGFGAAIAMLHAGIAHHVAEEETEVFPKLRAHMGTQANSNGAKRRSAKARS